jgi:hypothetical protein
VRSGGFEKFADGLDVFVGSEQCAFASAPEGPVNYEKGGYVMALGG